VLIAPRHAEPSLSIVLRRFSSGLIGLPPIVVAAGG
jgi:hypothetical protein